MRSCNFSQRLQKRTGTALSHPAAPPSGEPRGSAASERPPLRAAGPAAAGWGRQRRARAPRPASSAAASSSESPLTSGTQHPRCHRGAYAPAAPSRRGGDGHFLAPAAALLGRGTATYNQRAERTPPSVPEPPARRSARLRSAPPGGSPCPAGSGPAPARRPRSRAGQAGGPTAAPPGGSGGTGAPGGPRLEGIAARRCPPSLRAGGRGPAGSLRSGPPASRRLRAASARQRACAVRFDKAELKLNPARPRGERRRRAGSASQRYPAGSCARDGAAFASSSGPAPNGGVAPHARRPARIPPASAAALPPPRRGAPTARCCWGSGRGAPLTPRSLRTAERPHSCAA